MAVPKTLRCAVYTRKSSEEGLEQDFNSLHAQREACEAYVLSQAGEGWTALPARYDDGGISGGTMERPALQRLLADIAGAKVDVVVVYKVDRLTRSLGDFARIVEVFDRHGVSFVSVTQAFNTTSSMGRLTLNVLLSFAQFEREVTGERIRDKIAASKRKGLWMGGVPPLGYEPSGRTLKVLPDEAEQVRHIYRRYLELGSVHRLKEELEAQGFRSKQRRTHSGKQVGGAVMTRGALFHLLSNRLYVGEIPHRKESHPGQHPPIVERVLFDQVQAALEVNRRARSAPTALRLQSPLTGLIFDADGRPMSPTTAKGRGGRRYRYYVSAALLQGERVEEDGSPRRLAAQPLEMCLLAALRRVARVPEEAGWHGALAVLDRIDVALNSAVLHLKAAALARGGADLTELLRILGARLGEGERAWATGTGDVAVLLPVRMVFRGGRTWLVSPSGFHASERRTPDRAMVAALRLAHSLVRRDETGPVVQTERPLNVYQRRVVPLAFLAPDIQQAMVEGRQPRGLLLKELLFASLPADWHEQRRLLGFC